MFVGAERRCAPGARSRRGAAVLGAGRGRRGGSAATPTWTGPGALARLVVRAVGPAARRHPPPDHRRDVGAAALDRARSRCTCSRSSSPSAATPIGLGADRARGCSQLAAIPLTVPLVAGSSLAGARGRPPPGRVLLRRAARPRPPRAEPAGAEPPDRVLPGDLDRRRRSAARSPRCSRRSCSRPSSSTRWPSSRRCAMCPGAAADPAGPAPRDRVVRSAASASCWPSRWRRSPGHRASSPRCVVLAVVACRRGRLQGRRHAPKAFALAVGALLVVRRCCPSPGTLVTERSFFGVTPGPDRRRGRHQLLSGTTLHGVQDPDAAEPLVRSLLPPRGTDRPVLHAGRPDRPARRRRPSGSDRARWPATAAPATTSPSTRSTRRSCASRRTPRYFTYLRDSRPTSTSSSATVGSAWPARPTAYDTLVLDAFSSDAIPVHLLTREAFDGYLDQLAPDGVIAVHITTATSTSSRFSPAWRSTSTWPAW